MEPKNKLKNKIGSICLLLKKTFKLNKLLLMPSQILQCLINKKWKYWQEIKNKFGTPFKLKSAIFLSYFSLCTFSKNILDTYSQNTLKMVMTELSLELCYLNFKSLIKMVSLLKRTLKKCILMRLMNNMNW